MANENSAGKGKKWGRRLLKVTLLGGLSIMAVMWLAGVIMRYSGSNQWELVGDKNGVKIYSLKPPGSDSTKLKSVFRVHATLGALVRMMQDPGACDYMGCYDARIIERVDDQLMYYTFRIKLGYNFVPREYVVRTQVHQDPATKEVLVVYAAALGKTPLNTDCVRVTEMNNSWRLTPLGGGQVEVEYIIDMYEEGFVPKLLLDRNRPKILFKVLPLLQKILDMDRYRNTKLPFIAEM